MIRLLVVLVLVGASVNGQTITTQTFGSGANQFSIDFVEVGNPGNAADDTGFGAVGYTYNLGKYEISRDQILKANAVAGLGITLQEMASYGGNGFSRPATGISWNEAAMFVNYLNTSQGKQAAYLFDVSGNIQLWSSVRAAGTNLYRHKNAYYFLPSIDEWYKGGYGSPNGIWYDYPNGSDSAPTSVTQGASGAVYGQSAFQGPADVTNAGGLSAWETMAQGGNAAEWTETAFDGSNNSATEDRELRGGSWDFGGLNTIGRVGFRPSGDNYDFGFRVASVPEPSSLCLLLAGGALLMAARRRKD